MKEQKNDLGGVSPTEAAGVPCSVHTDSASHVEQSEDAKMVAKLTAIVREADQVFQKVGGGSRHWVRDCFLPVLNREGLAMMRTEPHQCVFCDEDIRRDSDGEWIDRETHTTCKGKPSRHQPCISIDQKAALGLTTTADTIERLGSIRANDAARPHLLASQQWAIIDAIDTLNVYTLTLIFLGYPLRKKRRSRPRRTPI